MIDSTVSPLWRLITWIKICISSNNSKNMKAEPVG